MKTKILDSSIAIHTTPLEKIEFNDNLTITFDDEKLNIVMEECFAIAQEFAELKQFKCDKLAADTEFAVKQILAEVRSDLPQDKYAELEAESKNCSYDEIEQFKTRAQAFAYQFGIRP